jgi:transcriptional regulator with XRE-family HTH domain
MREINFVDLGARLAYWRRWNRLRQADLARELGIHPVTLSRIEHGRLPGMTVAVLARLALRLDVSLDELLELPSAQRLRQQLEALQHAYFQAKTEPVPQAEPALS